MAERTMAAGLFGGHLPGARRYKGTGSTTTTSATNTDPWSAQQPFLKTGFARAKTDVLDRPLSYFPESTVVPFSPESEVALAGQAGRAISGSPLLSGAQDYTGDVLSGKFTDPSSNPFLSGVSDAVLSEVQPRVASTFSRAGRTGGSPLQAEALGRGVSRGMAPYLFGEYGRERGIQEAAAARAPALAREDYYDIGQLGQVGAAREAKAEEGLAEQIARFNFGQQEPTNRIAQFTNLIQGNYGGTSTGSSTAKQSANTGMLIAGTALRAFGMGK